MKAPAVKNGENTSRQSRNFSTPTQFQQALDALGCNARFSVNECGRHKEQRVDSITKYGLPLPEQTLLLVVFFWVRLSSTFGLIRLSDRTLFVLRRSGYGDLGRYGQPRIQTPHLDRMAEEGMRFTPFMLVPLFARHRGVR